MSTTQLRAVLVLALTFAVTPGWASNDDCPGAVPLDVPGSVAGSTVGATADSRAFLEVCPGIVWKQPVWAGPPAPGVWFSVTGTGNRMTATTCRPGTTVDTQLKVFCSDCEHLVCAGGNDNTLGGDGPACEIPSEPGLNLASTVTWCSRAGQTYRILVYATGELTGDFELAVSDSGTPCWGAVDCSPVDVVASFLSDNGDHDGWADPHETVGMRVSVYNRTGTDLNGVEARLSADDPRIACVAEPVLHIGDLAAGETLRTSGAFTFRVADAHRGSEAEDFSAALRVALSTDSSVDVHPPRCSVSGEPCDADDDCPYDDLCENMLCEDSGLPCRSSWLDCESTPGDYELCVGVCSLSGRGCGDDDIEHPGLGPIVGCDGPDTCVDDSQEIRIDLDLDASGGLGAGPFFEGFESAAFGAFTTMNLDAGLNDPVAADDYRCQYIDPDNPHANPPSESCYPGVDAAHADAYFWQVNEGRAFRGTRSLYMGADLGGGWYTTPLSLLEAIRTEQPINLDWAQRCSVSGTHCTDSADCLAGEQCLAAAPSLSFKHQVSLVDWLTLSVAHIEHGTDRGVVQVQLADDSGNPVGPWIKLEPYRNGYHTRSEPFVGWSCVFDPIDDGNTEDDLFGSEYPLYRYGPSSTCFPELTFSRAGSTAGPFDPAGIGMAGDGPGLQGETGPGTWVESRVGLEQFRGRRIRLRFLATSLEWGTRKLWSEWAAVPEYPNDDGWWIDDVTVTGALVTPATIGVDEKDNTALAADTDSDCVGNTADCAPSNDQIWALPGEVQRLRLYHNGGVGGTTTLRWVRPQALGGGAVSYVTQASGPGFCTERRVGPSEMAEDAATPAPRTLHTFLVRAENGCGPGSWGRATSGAERPGCP